MSYKELAHSLIDQIPESRLYYVILYLQGAAVPDETNLLVTDASEHSLKYDMSGYGGINRGLVIYSVVNADGRQSEVPTKNYFDSDTAGSVLLNTVSLSHGYTNSTRDCIYLYTYGRELDTSSQPNASAFSIVDGDGNPLTGVMVKSVQIVSKKVYATRISSYVLLSLSASLPKTSVYLSYEAPETGALQDTLGNKVKAFARSSVSTAATEMSAVMSQDQKYMCITAPFSEAHTNFGDMEFWMDDVKISSNKMVDWIVSTDGMNAYIQLDTSVVSAGSLVVKAVEGKTLYNAAEEEFKSLKVSKIDREEKISFVSPLYDTEEKSLYIEVNGFKSVQANGFYACDFIIQVAGKEYRMRGRTRWQQIDGTWRIVFNKDCLKHIPGLDNGLFQVKYSPLLPQEGHNSPYASGKPMVATEYMDVDIQ